MEGSNHIDPALQGFVSRLDNLSDDRDALNGDFREVYDEAREAGYNIKALRQLVRERRMDQDALAALNETLDEYRAKLGGLVDMPLGEAAVAARKKNGRGRRADAA
jgi:uncharacterized protein (UPF0335 family)